MRQSEHSPDNVARFEIPFTCCIGEDGSAAGPLPPEDSALWRRMYEAMVRTRVFDRKAVALQRTGQLGTYASCLGQEAIGTAIGLSLGSEDVYIPAYREYAAQFLRGVPMHRILQYWGGDEAGMDFPADTPSANDFPLSVPIATHMPHAVGVAYAMQLRRQARVVLASCGDGATSKGDFYEALNAAGVWRLPIVFVVSNNQWAISMPRARQSAAQTIAQKAIAAGIRGEQVDGNDVIAVHQVLSRAIAAARQGDGPRLVEAVTYRLHDHTTADDARRYRSETEVRQAWERCPIKRSRLFLEQHRFWTDKDEFRVAEEAQAEVDAEVRAFLEATSDPDSVIFDHLYAELPRQYAQQRAEVARPGSGEPR